MIFIEFKNTDVLRECLIYNRHKANMSKFLALNNIISLKKPKSKK